MTTASSLPPAGVHPGPESGRPTRSAPGRRAVLWAAAILAAAAAVRFAGLGAQSLSIDELTELRIARLPLAEIWSFPDGIPPLFSVLLHLVLPLGDLAGRVLSGLLGVGTVAVGWAWARRVGGPRPGLIAALLLAFSPVLVQQSQDGRAPSLLVFLAAASLWSLWRALEQPSAGRWAAWGVVSALGLWSHYLFAPVIVAALAVVLAERRVPAAKVAAGLATLLVLASPIVAIVGDDMSAQLGESAGPGLRLPEGLYAVYTLFAGFSLGPARRDLHDLGVAGALGSAWPWVALVAVVAVPLAAAGYRGLRSPQPRRLVVLAATAGGLLVVLFAVTGAPIVTRYLAWLILPVAAWAAAGLVRLPMAGRAACAAALAALAASSIVARALDPHHDGEDYRGVAAYLEQQDFVGRPVLVTGEDQIRPIVYYLDREIALSWPPDWDQGDGHIESFPDGALGFAALPPHSAANSSAALAVLEAFTEPGEPYLLVYLQPHVHDPDAALLAYLAQVDGLVLVHQVAGLDVYRGVRSP